MRDYEITTRASDAPIPKVGEKTPVCRYRSPSDRGRNVNESALHEKHSAALLIPEPDADWRRLLKCPEPNCHTSELAIQGANAGLAPEARAAISGEMGALQKGSSGLSTSIGSNTLADGGTLGIADDTGSVIAQELPPMGPTAANLSGRHRTACSRDFFRQQRTLIDSKRKSSLACDNVYARAESNPEHGKPCASTQPNERSGERPTTR